MAAKMLFRRLMRRGYADDPIAAWGDCLIFQSRPCSVAKRLAATREEAPILE
jgi:hypothetical protein